MVAALSLDERPPMTINPCPWTGRPVPARDVIGGRSNQRVEISAGPPAASKYF
jgi:hypothetical protein